MKMNSAQIEQTLNQIQAQAIPAGHPAMPQLERLFGGHTFFLDSEGLNIVEPVEAEQNDRPRGVVADLASWADETKVSFLSPTSPSRRTWWSISKPTRIFIDEMLARERIEAPGVAK